MLTSEDSDVLRESLESQAVGLHHRDGDRTCPAAVDVLHDTGLASMRAGHDLAAVAAPDLSLVCHGSSVPGDFHRRGTGIARSTDEQSSGGEHITESLCQRHSVIGGCGSDRANAAMSSASTAGSSCGAKWPPRGIRVYRTRS